MQTMTIIESHNRRKGNKRKIGFIPGNDDTYRVEPLNPQKLKDRDRVCTFLKFEEGFANGAIVRFHDNNREKTIDPGDLMPINAELNFSTP